MPAAELCPSSILRSSLHEVEPEARLDGLLARFRVRTPYGTYDALGRARLAQLLAETRAIHALRGQPSQGFSHGLIESIPVAFMAIRTLLRNPAHAARVWPLAMRSMLNELTPLLSGWRSESEDSLLEALATVSKFKRRIAESLHVDVYSGNPILQYELDRLGWEASVGNWTPSLLTIPLDLGIGYSFLSMSRSLEVYLREFNPAEVRTSADKVLKGLGTDAELRDRLQENPVITPRHLALLVERLRELPHAKQRALAAAWIADADLRLMAFYKLRALGLLPAAEEDPVVELARRGDLLAGKRQSGAWVLPLPADVLLWTGWLEEHVDAFTAEGDPLVLVVEGRVSSRAREELTARGVDVQSDVPAR